MPDREKVIKGLECCTAFDGHGFPLCEECPYAYDGTCPELDQLHRDALELLKVQEPILLENQHKPYGHCMNANSPWISRCPKCGKKVEGKQTKFCKYCGKAVKWDA